MLVKMYDTLLNKALGRSPGHNPDSKHQFSDSFAAAPSKMASPTANLRDGKVVLHFFFKDMMKLAIQQQNPSLAKYYEDLRTEVEAQNFHEIGATRVHELVELALKDLYAYRRGQFGATFPVSTKDVPKKIEAEAVPV